MFTWPSHQYGKFVRSALNWSDFLAILPFWIDIANHEYDHQNDTFMQTSVNAWRVLQIGRVMRLFKVIRLSKQLRLAYRAFKKSKDGILMLFLIFLLAIAFFSTLMFYAESLLCEINSEGVLIYTWSGEKGTRCSFQSIADGMWWVGIHSPLRRFQYNALANN
jgi:hypothetical protein